MGRPASKPFIPKLARRVVEAAKDQPAPTEELKTALRELMDVTEDPERIQDGETTCTKIVPADSA